MKELIVGISTNVAYADGTTGNDTITSLTNGAIAVLQEDGTLVDGAVPVFTKDKFYIALGRTTEGTYHSQLINRETCKVTKINYVAPTPKQYTTTFAVTASLAVGTPITLIVTNQEKQQYELNRNEEYQYVTKSGDTATIIADELRKIIDADIAKSTSPMYGIIASVTDNNAGVLTIVGSSNKNFTVANYDLDSEVTSVIAVSVPLVRGIGVASDILAFEKEVSTEDGQTNALSNRVNLYTVASRVETGVTYDQYLFTWTNPKNTSIPTNQAVEQELTVAVKAGNAIETALDNIIAAI